MIYADNAATTCLSEFSLEKMMSFLKNEYGNPSSLHSLGRTAKQAIELSRKQFATALNAIPDEIFFTSGGTEGNNAVLSGIATKESHIIVSSIEHPSIINVCAALSQKGIAVSYLPVDKDGCLSTESVLATIRPNTRLVSIMLANNEIGTIQPIADIALALKNKDILLHTDAVQAVGHIPVDVRKLGVDFLTCSAHKFGGPKGIGVLYCKKGVSLSPLIYGGGQEKDQRSGTENVAGIVGAGYAIYESTQGIEQETRRIAELSRKTIAELQDRLKGIAINGHPTEKLNGIISLTINNVSGEALTHILDMKGICISTHSACHAGKGGMSSVLSAIGLTDKQNTETIRISYGKNNTDSDVSMIVDSIATSALKIRATQ